jgi:hypothetical protein
MATIRAVCGDCGAQVGHDDLQCPRCGAALSWGGETAGRRCPVCGHVTHGGGTACESCGAQLPGSGTRTPERQKPQPKPQKRKEASPKERRWHPDAWQVISFVAFGVLVAYFLFSELSRETGRPMTGASSAGAVSSAPVVQDVAPLEQAVAANPKDAAAQLRLANALHDNGMTMRAVEVYKRYLALRPDDPDARVDLGICYDQLALADSANARQWFSLALQEMEDAARRAPTHQAAAFNLGIVNLHGGHIEESNTWFRRAVEINKSSDLGMRAQKILEQHTFQQ